MLEVGILSFVDSSSDSFSSDCVKVLVGVVFHNLLFVFILVQFLRSFFYIISFKKKGFKVQQRHV